MEGTSHNNQLSLNDIHSVLLGMLKKFDRFCEEHNLVYYLANGTLLGAIRHDGFIPWDDDADIVMPRKDYERLLSYKKIDEDIEIISFHNHSSVHYHPFPYIDLADTNTIEKPKTLKRDPNKGQFIDIFPLDSIPDNAILDRIQRVKLSFLTRIRICAISTYRKPSSVKNIVFNFLSLLCSPLDAVKLSCIIDSIAKLYSDKKTKKLGMIVFNDSEKFRWQTIWFENSEKHKFEDASLSIPSSFHEILKANYGDYMTPPPESERIGHHFVEIYWKGIKQ